MKSVSHIYQPRRVTRFGWVLLMLLGVVLVVVLFFIKARALEARAKVRHLEHVLAQEKAEVRMINAEIAHLENPDRLRTLAQEHLGLEPVTVEQTLTLKEAVAVLQKKPELKKQNNGEAP